MKVVAMFLVSGVAVGSLYALGGIGLVVLYRATGILNFAYGAIAAASAMLCWQVAAWGLSGPVSWAVAISAGIGLSLAYGGLVAPGLAWREPVVKAVATLGFALVLLGLVSFLWDDAPRRLTLPTDKVGFRLIGVRITATRLIAFGAGLATVIGVTLYLNGTRMGLHMRSLAANRDLSGLLGIPVTRVETAAWGISGALAGFTGLMYGDLVRLDPTVITFMVIPAIAAAICGRLESLPTAFIAGLAIGVIEALLALYKPLAPLRSMTPFVVAAIVILWMQRRQTLTFSAET